MDDTAMPLMGALMGEFAICIERATESLAVWLAACFFSTLHESLTRTLCNFLLTMSISVF